MKVKILATSVVMSALVFLSGCGIGDATSAFNKSVDSFNAAGSYEMQIDETVTVKDVEHDGIVEDIATTSSTISKVVINGDNKEFDSKRKQLMYGQNMETQFYYTDEKLYIDAGENKFSQSMKLDELGNLLTTTVINMQEDVLTEKPVATKNDEKCYDIEFKIDATKVKEKLPEFLDYLNNSLGIDTETLVIENLKISATLNKNKTLKTYTVDLDAQMPSLEPQAEGEEAKNMKFNFKSISEISNINKTTIEFPDFSGYTDMSAPEEGEATSEEATEAAEDSTEVTTAEK